MELFSNIITFHLVTLTAIFFITWYSVIHGYYLIDDHEGVRRYADRLTVMKDPAGNTIKVELVDTYEENGKKWKNRQFNNSIPLFPAIIRWLRINLGKKFVELGKNEKGHEVYGFSQDPVRHHIISLVIQYVNVLLAYMFLSKIIGPELTFYALLLYIVHPATCQVIAWISGYAYSLSLTFALILLNVALFYDGSYSILPTIFLTYASCSALLVTFSTWIILAFFGKWFTAITALIVSSFCLISIGKGVVSFRKKQFESQNMGKSTNVNLRKPIIMIKTLYYYLRLLVFPKRLGLFHKWGYHYDDKLERFDLMFFAGLLSMIGMVLLYFLFPLPVKFGVLWFLAYMILFSNIMTAQQFVVDRYAFISSLGFCVVLAYFLHGYPIIFFTLFGLYLMRTWAHIPTFLNEESFYESNIKNFPDSEIAYGNLGVIQNMVGKHGTAVDTWIQAIKINPFYDVPHCNLFGSFQANGMLEQARHHIIQALNCKIVHFKDRFEEDLKNIDKMLAKKRAMDDLNNRINIAINTGNYEEVKKIKQEMDILNKPPEVKLPIPASFPVVPPTIPS
ncbi:hypothetical protein KKH13_05185 [Patescibacteria group bacterium]|nr:hypothetical protein [Patescibacteria group bacterium]